MSNFAPIRTTWQSHFVWSLTRFALLQYVEFEQINQKNYYLVIIDN